MNFWRNLAQPVPNLFELETEPSRPRLRHYNSNSQLDTKRPMEQQHYRVANGDVYICLICKDQPQVGKGRYAWESHEKNKKHQLNVARVRYYSNNPPSNSQDISASPAAATSSTSSTNNGEANMTATITSHHSSEESIAPETILLDRSKRKRDDSDSDGASDVGGGRKIHQLQDLEDDNPWVLLNDSASNDAASSASASNDGLQINVRTEPSPFQHQLATLKTPRPEWIPSDRVYEKTFPEMLHREILDFVQYVSPSQNDHNAREFLVGRFRSAVHQLWGHPSCKRSGQQWCDLLTFGSFRTRTYLPDGDMDLTVVTNRSGAEQVLLGELRDMILKRGYCTKRDIIALYNARVNEIIELFY
jgi:hypothetical protein